MAYGKPFYKWSPKNDVPYAIDKLSVCLSVCDVGVLWSNGWTDQDEGGRPQPRPQCVR